MNKYIINRRNLYNDLIALGYFQDEEGQIELSQDDFCESMGDEESVRILYSNLIEDGFYRGDDGSVTLCEDDFLNNFIDLRVKQDYYPLTENQRGLYVDWELNSDALQYNIPSVRKIDSVDAELLQDKLIEVVNAHPYMKTRMANREGEIVQLRLDDQPAEVSLIELTEEPTATLFQSRVRSFNLLEDNLYRIEIYHRGSELYLFTDFHHIIFDGVSTMVFMNDLLRCLSGEVLEEESYTAFDYALEEQKGLNSDLYQSAENYFEELLSTYEVASYPKSIAPDTEKPSHKSVNIEVLGSEISSLCLQQGVTENSYFMASTMETLRRLLREENLLITSITNGRESYQMQSTLGMFVKTLPLLSYNGNGSIVDAAKEVQRQYINTQSNSLFSYAKIVEKYHLHSEILFAFQGGVTSADDYVSDSDNGSDIIALNLDTVKMPLSIQLFPKGDNYILNIEYDASLYSGFDIEQLGKAIKCLAENAALNNTVSCSSLALISDDDEEKITQLGSSEQLDYDRSETIVDLFRRQVALTPDATAIVYRDREMSYCEVDEITDRLAVKLLELGVKPQSAVGVMIDRSELMLIYPMAIMKAGATYMPLDSSFPEDRLSYMCEDAEVELILSDDNLVQQVIPNFNGKIFEQKDLLNIGAVTSEELATLPAITPDNVYVILYTSGSTGTPKGCMLEHHNMVNYCYSAIKEFDITAEDRFVAYSNFGFDAHMIDMYLPISVGASTYIIPSDLRLDIVKMNNYIEENALTFGFMTTQIGYMFATTIENKSLRLLTIGGEKLPPLKSPAYRLYNVYGPTECTIFTTAYSIDGYFDSSNIGRPLAGYQLYIVDKQMQLVPQGVPGELVVAGAGVARGYLNRSELNAEKFISFANQQAYRTGDLVRWASDGNIDFIGRIDNQVKLRGLRIELGEIEAQLSLIENISTACVDVKEVGGMQNLVCYLCEKEGINVDIDMLKAKLSETLTSFMVPEIYVKLDSLPLTPNGKVNRRALPIPQSSGEQDEMVAPENQQEQELADIVGEVLKSDRFGVTTNLITVGMTSLSAMRISALMQQRFGYSISTKEIIKQRTIRNIVDLINSNSAPQIEDYLWERRQYYPITENQRGIYIDWELNRETTQYNVPFLRKVSNIDAQRLKEALVKVVDAHEYLKTRFGIKDGDVVQLRADNQDANVGLQIFDYEPTVDFFQSRVRPFDLFEDDLYRLEIYQTPQSLYLFQDFHHTIFDGISDLLFMRDLQSALEGLELEAEKYSSYEHSLLQQSLLTCDKFKEAESYFDTLLSGAESTIYPHSSEGTIASGYGKYEFTIPMADIDEFSRKNGVTSNAYFMTMLTQLLHRVTRQESLLISTIDNGREDSRWMDTVGMFVKTYPVVSSLDEKRASETTIADATQHMHQQLIQTVANGFYPFTYMAEKHHIRPEVLFVYHGTMSSESDEDTRFEQIKLSSDMVKVPLTVTIFSKGGDDYTVLLIYKPSLYSLDDMKRLASAFKAISINSLEATSLAQISMLNQQDKEVIEGFHSTAIEDIPYKLYHQPIEVNATKYGSRKALVAKDRTLTFAEFNTEANRVAHALIRRGVKRGNRVLLLLPRRSSVIVSMFAISKTGAAYIPCDPEYPADRINLIMTDSQAQYIITTKEYISDYPSDKVIDIDDIYMNRAALLDGDDENPNVEVSEQDLAYLIYTSGSTGRPKGVMLRHIGIANYLYDHPANVHIRGLIESEVKSFVSITTLSFDMSLKEFAGSLFNGVTSILADEEEIMDASLLAKLMKRTNAEGINGTCSRLLTYMELDEFCDALSNCKTVWSGGEKYPMSLLTNLQKMGVRIFNTYGPTEITVSSNIKEMTNSQRVTVGQPLLNYKEYIVDIFDNELPQGFVGELLIGGHGVAKGYNNLPEMTQERFVKYKGIDIYRSGDLARWLPDGDVEILGRNDGQIKLRGFRIELGEIESLAVQFVGVKQAVADVKTIGAIEQLCLYYTTTGEVDKEQLKEFLTVSLTEYMIPTFFIEIDAIPLTPNGKTNRKALPIPKMEFEEIIEAENATEEAILEVVKELLNVDELGVTNNLVTFGLSSIAAMRLSTLLLQNTHLKISVKDILKYPTVREMALLSGESNDDNNDNQLKPYPMRQWYPMSESQRSMVVDWMLNPNGLQYNIPVLVRYKTLDVERLKEAIRAIGEAHPYLKARLKQNEDDIVQTRHDDHQITISEESLDFEPDREYFQSRLRPFDLFNEALYRFKIYKTPSYYYLFMDIHHVISDGSSNYVLAKEMERAYRGEKLVKEEYTAFDRAIDEENIMQSERKEEAEVYFDNLIDGAEATVYPHSVEVEKDCIYGRLEQPINSEAIDLFCQQNMIAPSSFFLTIFHNVLHRVTREENTLVYFISNGRSEVQLDNFFGVFVKTMPTVVNNFTSDIISSAKAIRQQMIDTISYDYYPFTKMVERYGLKAEILYNYFVDLQTNMSLDNNNQESIGLDWDTPKTPISLTMVKNADNNYEAIMEYDSRLYNSEDIRSLLKMFAIFSEKSVTPTYKSLNEISLISEQQTQDIIKYSKGVTRDYDFSKTFTNVVVERALERPQAVAVVDNNSKISYGELNTQSDTLAKILIDSEVGRNQFVALMMDRSKEFVTSVLAIHKCGAAYLPLDIEYPNERLNYMLSDSAATVLVTKRDVVEAKLQEGGLELGNVNVIYVDDVDFNVATTAIDLSTPQGNAYMIYTSGSTGKPKGAVLHHKGLVNFTYGTIEAEELTSADRVASHRAFSFDAHIDDLCPILAVGGELHIMPSDIRKDLQLIYEYIVDHKVTGVGFTTSLSMLLLNNYDLPIRFITAGGEKLTGVKSDSIRIINLYGPTECTNTTNNYIINPGEEYENIPIGRVLPNMYGFVVDPHGQLLPKGIVGELCLAGIQVGRGYWNLPQKTQESFLDSPFVQERMYRTGDLVRYNLDGQLEYYGRIDGQVKLRGFRIEVGEIESVVNQHNAIKQSVAKVCDVDGVKQLVLYYTLLEGVTLGKDQLFDFIDASPLAKYMLPEVFMELEQMPLLPNGKINRKMLPKPEAEVSIDCEPAKNQKEELLLNIARELLKRDDFGVTSDLRKMGMTSLLAMKLLVQASAYNIHLKVGDLLKYRSIRGLLDNVMSLSCWIEKPQVDKPIVIFIHGVTNFYQAKPYLQELSKHFSVYQIENIVDHYSYIFQDADIEEVVEMYYTLLDTFLESGAQVYAFAGHSFGGELAYRVMCKWSEEKGQKPMLQIFDTHLIKSAERQGLFSQLFECIPPQLQSESGIDSLQAQIKVERINTQLSSNDASKYSGNAIYYQAMDNGDRERIVKAVTNLIQESGCTIDSKIESVLNKFRADDNIDHIGAWRELIGGELTHHKVNDSHNGLLDKQYVETYVQDLLDSNNI